MSAVVCQQWNRKDVVHGVGGGGPRYRILLEERMIPRPKAGFYVGGGGLPTSVDSVLTLLLLL